MEWGQQEWKQRMNNLYLLKNSEEVFHRTISLNGITIRVSEDKTVEIIGAKNVIFESENVDFKSKNINFDATESMNINVDGTLYVGSSEHIINQAPRIDLNPYCDGPNGKSFSGYFSKTKNLVLDLFRRNK